MNGLMVGRWLRGKGGEANSGPNNSVRPGDDGQTLPAR
jgi:hypothetical protein